MFAPSLGRATFPPAASPAFLATLLALDLALIAAHFVFVTGVADGRLGPRAWLALDEEAGAATLFQLAKWLAIVGVLLSAGREGGGPAARALALVFAIVLADDALQIHERGGVLIGGMLGEAPLGGLVKPADAGALATFAALGLAIAALIVVGFGRATRAERRSVAPLLLVFGGLLAAGIGADLVASSLYRLVPGEDFALLVRRLATLADDGGEMILASVALWLALGLYQRSRVSPAAGP